jgi:hypothetical protein
LEDIQTDTGGPLWTLKVFCSTHHVRQGILTIVLLYIAFPISLIHAQSLIRFAEIIYHFTAEGLFECTDCKYFKLVGMYRSLFLRANAVLIDLENKTRKVVHIIKYCHSCVYTLLLYCPLPPLLIIIYNVHFLLITRMILCSNWQCSLGCVKLLKLQQMYIGVRK